MGQKKHQPEEIVAKLRQVDVLLLQGRPVAEAIRTISVTPFLGQPRSTQRKVPKGRADDAALTADIIELATRDGRYGYPPGRQAMARNRR